MTTKRLEREYICKGLESAVIHQQRQIFKYGYTIDSIEIGGKADYISEPDVWIKIKYSKMITIDED